MTFNADTVQRFRNAIKDEKAIFIFVPSAILKEKLTNKSDPLLNELPDSMVGHLLSCPYGSGIATDTEMILKYLDGTLDKNNSYLFSQGEIRVLGVGGMAMSGKRNINQGK